MRIKGTIGLIGTGNMGGAILEGLFKKKIALGRQIWVYDKIRGKAPAFARRLKTNSASDCRELVRRSRVVILAVKPQDLLETAREFKMELTRNHVLISILAGTPIAKIRRAVGKLPAIVRAMPNLGAKVGESVTALAGKGPRDLGIAEKIFSGCGKVTVLPEKYFDLVTAVSGSGPAYFFLLMEILAKEGERCGLSRQTAELLAVQTAVGAGLLARASSVSPAELRRMVTSQKGTTEAALKVLEKRHFSAIFHQALQAALRRGRKLSKMR